MTPASPFWPIPPILPDGRVFCRATDSPAHDSGAFPCPTPTRIPKQPQAAPPEPTDDEEGSDSEDVEAAEGDEDEEFVDDAGDEEPDDADGEGEDDL